MNDKEIRSVLKEVNKLLKRLEKKGQKPSKEELSLLEDITEQIEMKRGKIKEERDQSLVDKLEDLVELSSKSEEISQSTAQSIVEAINKIKLVVPAPEVSVEPPKVNVTVPEVKIPPIKVPEVVIPDTINVSKPSWIEGLINLLPVTSLLQAIRDAIPEFRLPTGSKEPISVRLSDGEKFYRALGGSGGAASIPTYKNSDGEAKQGLVDSDGHVQVDVQSSALPSGAATSANQTTQIDQITNLSTNNYTQLKVTQFNSSGVEGTTFNPAYASAFGTLETAELTPVFQGDFVYGLNTQMWNTGFTSGTGATVDTNASRLRVQSGTASNGYAYIQTRRPARYRAGQGTVARFTPLFTTGVANSIQLWGMGTIASNAPYDGYFFGYNGTSFGICHYIRGTAYWTAQADWNGTAITLNPIYGSPVMIKYPYLGFGDIMFFIQNATTGAWVLVHTIRYANTVTTTQLSNPTLKFTGFTLNSGNTTNLTMYCASVGIFVSGVRSFVGNPKWSMDSNKLNVTTEANLLSLKNATTYNGVTNTGLIRLNSIAFSSSAANGIAVMRLKIGVTLGGSPSYTTINGTTADAGVTITSGNSITSYDVAGTTIANGTYLYSITVDNPNTSIIDLTPYDIIVAPTEILTISGYSSATSQLGVSVNWSEDI